MAGLLNLDDPATLAQLQFGLGLLQAGGPSDRRIGIGQGIGMAGQGALQAYAGAKKANSDLELQKAHIELYKGQAERARKMAERGLDPNVPADIQKFEYYQKLDPEQRQVFERVQRASQIFDMNGVKYLNTPQGMIPLTTLEQQAQAEAYLAGIKQRATEQEKANYDLVPGYNPITGRLENTNRASQLGPMPPLVPPGAPRLPSASPQNFPSGYMSPADQAKGAEAFRNAQRDGTAPPGDRFNPVPGAPPLTPPAPPRLVPPEQAKRDDENMKAAQGAASALADANRALAVVDKAINHPGRATSTGLSGIIDPRNYIWGTDAKSFESVRKQIEGGAFLSAFEKLRGGGQITEIEGEKATAAIARLQKDQSDEAFVESMKDLKEVLAAARDRAQQALDRAKALGPQDGPAAPRSGPASTEDIVKKYLGG